MIIFDNIKKIFPGKTEDVKALDGVNLHIKKGEIYGVIGSSGAGKSTLIRCVNFLEKPTSGQVIVDGKDFSQLTQKQLRQEKRKIGMIFQHFNLLHSKTVFANVAMPLLLDQTPKQEVKKRVNELLDFVGLKDRANHYPDELSGGQKQRVGIARALATQPSILLCDEATSALDPETTQSILNLLKQVNKKYNITILMITHEMEVIRDICDKVAVLDEGRIIEQGSVFQVFSQPKQEITKKFIHSIMKDDIPESIYRLIEQSSDQQNIYRVIFIGDSASDPLFSQITKTFDVEVNILFGNITELQGKPFGNLIIRIDGEGKEIKNVIRYVKKRGVIIREVVHHAR